MVELHPLRVEMRGCEARSVDGSLHRYWVTLAPADSSSGFGFGLTAFDEADALAILAHVVFADEVMPEVLEMRVDVDVRDLDQGHVVPNMAPPSWRGVWYPKGFDSDIR